MEDTAVLATRVVWLGDEASHDPRSVGHKAAYLSKFAASYRVLPGFCLTADLSDVSSVLFSANPVTGRRDELVVSANWGFGESIVGGTVTPDTWIVSTSSLEFFEQQLGGEALHDRRWCGRHPV